MSEAALRSALERIGSDALVRFDEVTGSTQSTALELAEAGAPQWSLVAAAHQTEGKGRLGRTWLDEAGALLFSLVLRPEIAPERGGLLTLLAGAAMGTALQGATGSEVSCKWPNDLLLADAKVGGILASSRAREGVLAHVVLGVGVNLGVAPALPRAGALAEADPAEVLGAFLESFARDYAPGHESFPRIVIERYRAVSSTLGRRVRATTTEGDLVEGEAVDVDDLGGLVLRTNVGLATVRFGEVAHVDAGALPGPGTGG